MRASTSSMKINSTAFFDFASLLEVVLPHEEIAFVAVQYDEALDETKGYINLKIIPLNF